MFAKCTIGDELKKSMPTWLVVEESKKYKLVKVDCSLLNLKTIEWLESQHDSDFVSASPATLSVRCLMRKRSWS